MVSASVTSLMDDLLVYLFQFQIARINGKKPLPGKLELVVEQAASERGRVQNMIKPERRVLTLVKSYFVFKS